MTPEEARRAGQTNPQQLFTSAVEQYERYRAGYRADDVAALAARLGLDGTQTVADIGCGTGQLTIPLAAHARSVVAIDPVADMLAVGRRNAYAAGISTISWQLGDSNHLQRLVPPGTHLATFAASFHWTDRARVVEDLDRLLAPGGSIVTINDDLPKSDEPDWVRAVDALRNEYLGDEHTAATDVHTEPAQTHRSVFSHSSFADVHSLYWEWQRELTIDEAVGLQFTYSFSTPARFGDRADAFARAARATIQALHPNGLVTEPIRLEVLIASR